MKIAMIGHKYVPSREGGIEIVVNELSTRLAAQGHEVTLFNRKRKEYPVITEYNGCKVENIFTINKKSLDAIVYAYFATKKAKKLAKKGKLDVLHFHAEGPCFFLNILPRRKHRNYKIVVTIHGLDWQRGKWGGLGAWAIKKGEERAVKYADDIIVLSKSAKKYFGEKYHRTTKVIPNGISSPTLLEANIIKEKFGLEKDSFVLFVGRIVPEKGLDYLISAWKQLTSEQKAGKKLVIAGGDSHATDYYNHIVESCQGDDSIILTGFVQGDELKELFSNSYLYVLPSDLEGMPMSLLEAMSYGNVCLVSDIPENTDIINESCYVFKQGFVDRLRHQLKKIIAMNLTTHADSYIPFTWDDVVDQTLHLYQREY